MVLMRSELPPKIMQHTITASTQPSSTKKHINDDFLMIRMFLLLHPFALLRILSLHPPASSSSHRDLLIISFAVFTSSPSLLVGSYLSLVTHTPTHTANVPPTLQTHTHARIPAWALCCEVCECIMQRE